MPKECQICGYEPAVEDVRNPSATNEDCPNCGGEGTLVNEDAEAAGDEGDKEE